MQDEHDWPKRHEDQRLSEIDEHSEIVSVDMPLELNGEGIYAI